VGLRDVFRTDLVLLHPPSVYDFRSRLVMHGPIADAVPSTNEFEMYPVGLTSIASYLSANHYNVRIVNLTNLMLTDQHFDVEAFVARLRPRVTGIDLHWLPHAHGALAIAELLKRFKRRQHRGAVPPAARRLARAPAARRGGEPDLEGRAGTAAGQPPHLRPVRPGLRRRALLHLRHDGHLQVRQHGQDDPVPGMAPVPETFVPRPGSCGSQNSGETRPNSARGG
jgi:hypothetical protein